MNILVVDDDEMVLKVCRGMLSQLEHSCVCVNSAVQAIEVLTASTESFNLIILDNLLPQLSGMEMFAILREWKFSIPVILVSGMMPSFEMCEPGEQHPAFHFLGKPFTIAQLEAAIRKSVT